MKYKKEKRRHTDVRQGFLTQYFTVRTSRKTQELVGVAILWKGKIYETLEKIDGTFIQPWLYMTYDDEQWNKEMKALKEVGIEYLIIGDVANHNSDGT